MGGGVAGGAAGGGRGACIAPGCTQPDYLVQSNGRCAECNATMTADIDAGHTAGHTRPVQGPVVGAAMAALPRSPGGDKLTAGGANIAVRGVGGVGGVGPDLRGNQRVSLKKRNEPI